jgi:dTDP-4-amino-4,6-dideoxygalactose transaminase
MAMKKNKIIPVTSPLLPPLEEFLPYLEKIWGSRVLTNGGAMHQALEKALCDYLGVEHIALFANGTLALVTALQALRITGEVITTPYSFVATAHSLLWNGIKPVFVDVDPDTLNMDPAKIEAAITPQTTAILPVHCYGRACNVAEIDRIADIYNLRVIYDAAHAFGIRDEEGSILRHGDLSVLSFHATKVFNTFEGGAIICPDSRTRQRINHLKNFGFVNETTVVAPGINGKMSEINAAFGLLQLKYIDQALARRRAIAERYLQLLEKIPGLTYVGPRHVSSNNGYFPVLVGDQFGLGRDALYLALREQSIMVRRYFYPLISDFPMYRGLPSALPANLPKAGYVAERILCLPIFPDLALDEVGRICDAIVQAGQQV